MNAINQCTFRRPTKRLATSALALALALFAGAGTVHATAYTWTNTTSSTYDDPGAWSPVGGPGTIGDSATLNMSGTFNLPITNNVGPYGGSLYFGGSGGGNVTINMNFDTNNFVAWSANGSGSSGFVIGNAGTTVVYLAVGTLYVTNSTGGCRFTVGRNAGNSATFNLTNGAVVAQATVVAVNATATPSKIVVSGANSSWTNSGLLSLGNVASANFNSLVVSNSGSITVMSNFQAGFQATSHSNSVLVDTSGRLFTRGATTTLGAGAGSVGNTATIRGGGRWEAGGRTLTLGAGGGTGNGLVVGDSGVVSNMATLAISAGNFLSLSNGLLNVSTAVSNTSGTVSGFGTIVGNVIFTGTGTLSPSAGTVVGTLTVSNNLTLVSASTTIIRLDSSQAGSNDAINVVGTATIAGTLTVVTNGSAPLVAGDVYNIGITGGFTTTNLPPLDPTYRWNNVTPGILAIVPQEVVPGVSGLTNQLVNIGDTAVISGTVTGVPTPGVYWQKNGVNVTDGPTGSGSTNSGSSTTTLTISNAQTNDTASYCLIATNIVGASTNCMGLTVSNGDEAPTISGTSDQTVIQGNNGTFNASVSGSPTPTIQWFENGATITGATGAPLVLTNVQYSQNGFVYSLIASNVAGTATTNMTLFVIITPVIQTQPQDLTVTNTQAACFSVVSTNGVPPPTYQWFFNNNAISGATSSTYCIASAVVSNAGSYKVQVSNAAGTVTSSNATLTVNSIMSATLTPSNTAVNVCYDTPLYMAFDKTPFSSGTGKIKIFDASNTNLVDTIDTGLGNLQGRTIGTESFVTFPVIITSNTVAIYPHLGVLTSNQTYYVTVDPGTFVDTNAALFAGITDTNAWRFTTKPTGPVNPNNLVVAADGSGDFCTVMGAVDFVPTGNATLRLVNIRNGSYTEVVNTRTKNNITFRGQSRTGTVVKYTNNNNMNGTTHLRMAFKVFSDDIAIENLTVMNTTPQGGTQAEALMLETNIKRFILNNAEVDSRQDTILANQATTQAYLNNSLVQGNFDYVWGGGNCFFTNCEIRTIPTASSYNVTAARTENGATGNWQGPDGNYSSNGISFVNCIFTRADSSITNVTLAGGNGNPDANVAWISCNFDTNCYRTAAGSIISNSIFWQYANSNLDNTASVTFDMITVLTNGDPRLVCASSVTCWLNGWVPQLAPNILSGPTNLTVNSGQPAAFNVSATGVPAPTYQWLKAGTNLVSQTSATLSIAATVADDGGTYSVIVANGAGSVTNSATLTVIPTAFESWQQSYFGCTSCPQAAAGADPDGDGMSNQEEFLAGSSPIDSASALRIISAVSQGSDVTVTWQTSGGHTNVVQAAPGNGSGGYSNNFSDVSGSVVIPGSGDANTNFVDVGGATNSPSRYYRIRLVP